MPHKSINGWFVLALCIDVSLGCSSGRATNAALPPPLPEPAKCWDSSQDQHGMISGPRDPRERLTNIAIARQLQELHLAIGRYSRGERPVYAGTIRARDNVGANGSNTRDGLLDGVVWAILFREPTHPGAPDPGLAELLIVNEEGQRQLRMIQKRAAPSITEITPVTAWGTNAGSIGACRNCAPSLFQTPSRIDLNNITATRRFERFEGSATVHGVLERIPPGALSFAQIARAHHFDSWGREAAIQEIAQRDGELVRVVRGRADEPAPEAQTHAPAGYTSCRRAADYSAEWWIDRTCLGRFGVWSVVFGPTATRCCVPYRGNDTPPSCVDVPGSP